jgi:stage II sporulation SpoAA-like protein
MIEEIAEMPAGTVGLRVWGEVTGEDYKDVLLPTVERAVNEHGEIRLLFQAGPDFQRFTASMIGTDVTKGLSFGVSHWSAWKRMAVVTDVEWLRHAMQMLGWMTPGEARLFALDEVAAAKEWVAA